MLEREVINEIVGNSIVDFAKLQDKLTDEIYRYLKEQGSTCFELDNYSKLGRYDFLESLIMEFYGVRIGCDVAKAIKQLYFNEVGEK